MYNTCWNYTSPSSLLLQAAILLQFKEKSQWQLSDLAAAVSLPPLALHKALILWTSQGADRTQRPHAPPAHLLRVLLVSK